MLKDDADLKDEEVKKISRRLMNSILRERSMKDIIKNNHVHSKKTYLIASKVFALRCKCSDLTTRVKSVWVLECSFLIFYYSLLFKNHKIYFQNNFESYHFPLLVGASPDKRGADGFSVFGEELFTPFKLFSFCGGFFREPPKTPKLMTGAFLVGSLKPWLSSAIFLAFSF